MLNESDFQKMIAEVQDHLGKVIASYGGLVNEIDDEHLRLQYMALYQAKQRQREALAALVALVAAEDAGPARRASAHAR